MKRIAVFGGTFDPPHIGHVNLLKMVLRRLQLDGAVILPAAVPPHKPGQKQAPYADRLAMTKIAFASMDNILVSDLEAQRTGPSYTVDTLDTICHSHPDWHLYFVTGGDAYENFTTWHRWQEILDLACLVITNRPGYELCCNPSLEEAAALSKEGMLVLQIPPISVSSTEIRRALFDYSLAENLIDPLVLAYIEKHCLYEEDKDEDGL